MHMINSVRGRAAVGTFEHYHPIFKRGETSSAVFQQPKEEKPNTARPITPQCSLPFSNLQGSCADLPGHSRNCHRAPHSHSCWDKGCKIMLIWFYINLSIFKMISRTNKGRKTIFSGHMLDCVHPRRQTWQTTVSMRNMSPLCCVYKDESLHMFFKQLNPLIPSEWDMMAGQQDAIWSLIPLCTITEASSSFNAFTSPTYFLVVGTSVLIPMPSFKAPALTTQF